MTLSNQKLAEMREAAQDLIDTRSIDDAAFTQAKRNVELIEAVEKLRDALERIMCICGCEENNELCSCSSTMMRKASSALLEVFGPREGGA